MPCNREELAWAAGLFDGEGTVGLRWSGSSKWGRAPRRIGSRLAMTTPDVVQRFAQAVGFGKVYAERMASKYPNAKPVTGWAVHSFEHVQALGALLWSFLSEPKRQQFKGTLTEYLAYPHRQRRKARQVAVAA